MVENVDNLAPEQLRLIREDLAKMNNRVDRLDGRMDEVGMRLQSMEGVLFGLGGYIRSIDQRVEHIETKLGA